MLFFSNLRILKFKSFISIVDDGNWIHPVEWERAAEELTWERVRIFYVKPVTRSGSHMQLFKHNLTVLILMGNQVSNPLDRDSPSGQCCLP